MIDALTDALDRAGRALSRAIKDAKKRMNRRRLRMATRELDRGKQAFDAGNGGKALRNLREANRLYSRARKNGLEARPAFERASAELLEIVFGLANPVPAGEVPRGWRPSKLIANPGDFAPWARFLGGSISPCSVVDFDGRRFVYFVGADSLRPDDRGPANRRLCAIEIIGDGQGRFRGPLIEHFPNRGKPGDYEEGVFSVAPIVDGFELRLYVGEVVLTSPGNVDVRTALYTSSDGLGFTRRRTITERPGSEVGPVAAFHHDGADYLIEFNKQVPGLGDWQFTVNRDPIPVSGVGAVGPIKLKGGRLAIAVVPNVSSELEVPRVEWFTFDPSKPAEWRRTNLSIPIAHEGAITADGRTVYALDSWQDDDARILELEATNGEHPAETAVPHVLRSDPRAWGVAGSIRSVMWGSDLEIEWEGVSDWKSYTNEGRWFYGHLCAIVQHEGRWVITGFEHLANAPSAPRDIVDTRFEGLADAHELGAQMQLGKVFQRGEEFYLFAAAPCRIGGGARYPQDVGLDPVRTRFAKVRFGIDGVEDAEPEWW